MFTRHVRLYAKEWHQMICMRVELIGCKGTLLLHEALETYGARAKVALKRKETLEEKINSFTIFSPARYMEAKKKANTTS